MVSGNDYLERAAVEKLRYALQVKKINEELLEYFASSLRWLIHYSEKNGIPLPEKDKIILAIDRVMIIVAQLPTNGNSTTVHNNGRINNTTIVVVFAFWLFPWGCSVMVG